jgi:hypothetical protein
MKLFIFAFPSRSSISNGEVEEDFTFRNSYSVLNMY